MVTNEQDMGMPDVESPNKWPMKIFQQKCQARGKARPPLSTTLRPAATPPIVRLMSPLLDAPGEPRCNKAKRHDSAATAQSREVAAET
mmetsp:Transcript_139344/g.256285  ORF Transcript_139344/g.256285 Transcript_139344/m.256285 type:complete len:88 (-) Transcript_139344:83-346(-)